MRGWKPAASAVVAALVVAGCGGGTGNGSSGGNSGYRACYDHLGQPLKAADLVAALEAEGFTMHSLPESRYCDGAGIDAVADVSNRRSAVDDDASDRQGWITCEVSRDTVFRDDRADPEELYADLDVGPYSPVGPESKAVFVLANASCTHYPPREDADAWTGRAHAAMKRLERQVARG